jgi:small subunit ribosomal protein S21
MLWRRKEALMQLLSDDSNAARSGNEFSTWNLKERTVQRCVGDPPASMVIPLMAFPVKRSPRTPYPDRRRVQPRRCACRKELTLKVFVRDNNVEQALRILKKKLQRDGLFREIKRRKAYEKPSQRKAREKGEAIRRGRKAARKLAQREGLVPSPRAKRPTLGRRSA